jgi:hypothetical protein
LHKSLTQQSDIGTILLILVTSYNIGRKAIPTYAEIHAMGYKDHFSNMDIHPIRMIVLLDVEIHVMGYRDHPSNSDICPRRMIVLDHFPGAFGHYCKLRENVCPVPISLLWSLETNHSTCLGKSQENSYPIPFYL